jgi:hypothetical protein
MLHDNVDNGTYLRTHKLFLKLQKWYWVFEMFIFITYLHVKHSTNAYRIIVISYYRISVLSDEFAIFTTYSVADAWTRSLPLLVKKYKIKIMGRHTVSCVYKYSVYDKKSNELVCKSCNGKIKVSSYTFLFHLILM